MCKKYIYLRVSTDKQSFEQQMQEIKNYGITPDSVDGIVEEHESGGKSYIDREFNNLLNKCERGDMIYAASTDRLGRSFSDMVNLMADAKKRGITIVACKQGLKLDDDSLATKMIIMIGAMVDEDERMRIKHRTKNKRDWQRQQIEEHGFYVIEKGPNAGKRKYTMGNEKGCDMTAAYTAAGISHNARKLEWREKSPAFKWVMDKVAAGVPRKEIIEEFNKLHELQPDVFCSPRGSKLTRGLLSYWIKDSNPLIV